MKKRELERKINRVFSALPPDALPSSARSEEQKGTVINMTNQNNRKKWTLITSVAAAFVLVLAGVLGFALFRGGNTDIAASIVSMDVNPGLEMKLDQNEKVLSVTALNKDAKAIIGDMDFSGSNMEVAVNAVIGSMLRNGYLSELSNSILVSVENEDPAEAERLQAKLTTMIQDILKDNTFEPAVIGQVTEWTDDLAALAGDTEISHGKTQLIKQLMDKNELYTFESLSALSVNELNLLLTTNKVEVNSSGSASEKSYIGKEKALNIALEHAGIAKTNATVIRTELDFDDGIMVYEIEFGAAGYEYDYEIGAIDGKVLESDKERNEDYPDTVSTPNAADNAVTNRNDDEGDNNDDDDKPASSDSSGSSETAILLTKDQAKSTVLKHAGLSAADIYDYEIDFDNDNGVQHYEIEFKSGNIEYSYDIHAVSGKILEHEKEIND